MPPPFGQLLGPVLEQLLEDGASVMPRGARAPLPTATRLGAWGRALTTKPVRGRLKWLASFFADPESNVYNRDLNLILAALFELRATCLDNQQTWDAIGTLAEKLGGDRSAMFFGAPPPERRPQPPGEARWSPSRV